MDRLTKKKEDRYFEGEEFWTSAKEPDEDELDRVYFKLADYEDIGTPQELAQLKSEVKSQEYKAYKLIEDQIKDCLDREKELKAENKALKERLEKAEAKLFITVRNNIVGEAVGDTDVIALMIIRNFDEMIDCEKAIKSKAEAEARLKELKGEKEQWDTLKKT